MSKPLISAAVACAAMISLPMLCGAAESKPDQSIDFRVLCLETRDNVISVLPPKGNPRKTVIPLFVGSLSEPITAKFADQQAAFYIDEKQPRGKIERKLVASGPLASGSRQVFIILPSNGNEGPVYRIIAFDDSDGVFPMGATRVLNLTPYPIRLNIAGKDQDPIKPDDAGLYPINKEVDEWNMYSVGIDLEVKEQEWKRISKQSWKASDRRRDWVVITYDVATKQPTIRQYQDSPPRPADEKGR